MRFTELNAKLRELTEGAEHIDVERCDGGAFLYVETADGLRHGHVPFPSDATFTMPEFLAALKQGRLPPPKLRRVA